MRAARLFLPVLLLLAPLAAYSQVRCEDIPVPKGVCVGPGVTRDCKLISTAPAVPAGPSPEELRRMHEVKDLNEAAEDAYDHGVDAYEKGNWDKAIASFKEALEYSPDDPGILQSLHVAQQRADAARAARAAAASEAARQLASADHHSEQAPKLSSNEAMSKEAGRGFDTAGKAAGTLSVSTVNAGSGGYKDPVVPLAKRTPAIRKMEQERGAIRKEASALQGKLKTLDPAKDAVEISKVRQQQSVLDNKVHYLNFSIGEQVNTPAPVPPAKTEK